LVLAALLTAASLTLVWALTRVPMADTPAGAPGSTSTVAGIAGGNPVRGREAYMAEGCAGCHGLSAEGGRFPGAPQLAGRGLTCDHLLRFVRRPPDPAKGMPPFSVAQVSDASMGDICAWLGAQQ
jgi:mono/diheme cytochrome c family protein